MDANIKKSVLRMIPYGLYILTARDAAGTVTASTVNWVTQTSFNPPLVAVGVKADSAGYTVVKAAGAFALNILGKGQQKAAFGFFKPAQLDGDKISGEPFVIGATGAPLLSNLPASVECKVVEVVARGDHHIVVGEVVEVHQRQAPAGRPDAAILEMKDLGDNVFYGG